MASDPIARLREAARRLGDAAEAAAQRERGCEEVDPALDKQIDVALAEAIGAQRQLFGPRRRAKRGEGALPRLRSYLIEHVGEEVSGDELHRVSGIHEWARRIRELRDEHGYEITELGGSLYRLESEFPSLHRAVEWQLLNSIRRSRGSALSRIETLLVKRVGEVVTREQIDYVAAPVVEGIRRLRELRDERGLPINSHIDEPALRPGEYRLVSADPDDRRDTRQRLYEEGVREKVYARDNYTCQQCGFNAEKAHAAGDTRFYLELHHKTAVAEELDALPPEELNRPENLITLCHRDHLAKTAELQRRQRQRRRSGTG